MYQIAKICIFNILQTKFTSSPENFDFSGELKKELFRGDSFCFSYYCAKIIKVFLKIHFKAKKVSKIC